MGMDKVFVHIAEKYYLSGEADWIGQESLTKLRERVNKIKPNIIGKKAPSLKLPTINNEFASLQDIDSKYTILYFWEPGCGHCKTVTPKLWEIYKKYNRDQLEIFAVYTQVNREKWMEYINDKGFDWVNTWDPQHTSNFRQKYDIYSTPTIYLINKDKEIIAKRIDYKSLEKMLEQKIGE
jgi:thiol-disulfide isomerase/thioredoxin